VAHAYTTQTVKPRRRLSDRDGFWAFAMLSPNLVGFLLFTLFPVIASLLLSFTSYDILTPPEWVGLYNYEEMFIYDKIVGQVVKNTLIYTACVVTIGIFISLMLALALDQKIKFVKLLRAAFFMPVITSAVAVSLVWQWLYNPDFGLLNSFLKMLGATEPPAWLNSRCMRCRPSSQPPSGRAWATTCYCSWRGFRTSPPPTMKRRSWTAPTTSRSSGISPGRCSRPPRSSCS
jgi:ABC-type sugar transport system permease subunit